MSGASNTPKDFVRKSLIVIVLFVGVLLLHHYAESPQNSTLLALGFVVLAAYLIGELVEVIKLPHITGYLLCGMLLGPSVPKTLEGFHLELIAPFDHGILNAEVIDQLDLLNTLALPLICLTAGGALNPKEIKSALRPISGILLGQIVTMFIGLIALFYLMSLNIPLLHMGVLAEQTLPAVLALGGVVAAISLATSDAATIAIVVSSKAKGPMTTNIISVAVLKDVVVVVAFSAMTTIAIAAMPEMESTGSLGSAIFNIFLSAIAGCVLGWLMHLYLKFVGIEILLFLTGLIYTVSFISDQLHLESALMFIAAGFVAANWSDYGDKLISEVERLSAPVFVVFFTLAGAKLHLDEVANMAVFAIMLVGVRAIAFYVGVRIGATLSKADEGSRKYAWMGFVSQAGLAITLADGLKDVFPGELGSQLYSFILAGVAINEIIGPAMLQAALSLAGEIPGEKKKEAGTVEANEDSNLMSWTPINAEAVRLKNLHSETKKDLITIIESLKDDVSNSRKKEIRDLVNRLQRSNKGGSVNLYKRQAMRSLSAGNLLSRWNSQKTLLELDQISDRLSDALQLDWESESVEDQTTDSKTLRLRKKIARSYLRFRPLKRIVDVRSAARYHFSGQLPKALIAYAEKLVSLERGLVDQFYHHTDKESLIDGLKKWCLELDELDALTETILSEAHRNFCSDLVVLSTPTLPAWRRRFGLTFHERNAGLAALTIDKEHVQKIVVARWNKGASELDFRRFRTAAIRATHQFCEPLLNEISSYYDSMASISDTIDEWKKDSRSALLNKDHESLNDKTDALNVNLSIAIEKGKTILANFNNEIIWEEFSADLGRTARAFAESATLPTNDQSETWSKLTQISVAPLALRDYATGNIETQFYARIRKSMSGVLPILGQNVSLLEDIRRVVSFNLNVVLEELNESDFETMQEMLIHSSERVQNRLVSLVEKEKEESFSSDSSPVNSAMNAAIGAMYRLIFDEVKPKIESEDIGIQSGQAIAQLLIGIEWLINQFRPLKPIAKNTKPSDVYLRLFDAGKADTQTLPPSRLLFREQICDDLKKNHSVALLGAGIEATAIGESIAESLDCTSITPKSFVDAHKLQEAAESSAGKPIVINGLRWLFDSTDKPSEALAWLSKHLHTYTWLIVAEKDVWNVVQSRLPLPKTKIVNLPALNESDLRAAILARHHLSGYAIEFPKPDHIRTAIRIWLGGGDPEKDWFKQLMKYSRGDLEEAFLLWTEGIECIDDSNGSMALGVLAPRASLIEGLTESELIVLRQILRQGWISSDLASHWFLQPAELMGSQLTSMQQIGLLDREKDIWTLSKGVRRPLRQKLAAKGWL